MGPQFLRQLEQREQGLNKRQSAIDKKRNEVERLRDEQVTALERVSEMSREEAREHLLTVVERDTRNDMARKIREIEEESPLFQAIPIQLSRCGLRIWETDGGKPGWRPTGRESPSDELT